MNKITAKEGSVFRRIHDQLIFSEEVFLGRDFSTGIERDDLIEYYEEIIKPEEIIIETP